MRLDNIKTQYQHELVPLNQQREALSREVAELKASREMFLEETTALNARNEELAQLNALYTRRMDEQPPLPKKEQPPLPMKEPEKSPANLTFDRNRPVPSIPAMPSISSSTTAVVPSLSDDGEHKRKLSEALSPVPKGKFLKWSSRPREQNTFSELSKSKGPLEHSFAQVNVLRFVRCDQCGDKMFGSLLRCGGLLFYTFCSGALD